MTPVLETPFRGDESIDEPGFARVVDAMLSAAVRSAMFPGFASEYHKLTDDERARLTRIFLEHTRRQPGFSAVVSVPDHATRVAVRRVREAVDAGAAAINVLPPHYLGPSRASVVAHLVAVLEAAGRIPVVLQYAPAQTGTALDAQVIARLAADHANLAYVKVESTPPGRLVEALAAGQPPVRSMVGYAGVQLPDALARGVAGVQPGCSFVEIYQRIWSLWQQGDHRSAATLHARLLPYIAYWMLDVELIIAAEKEISVRRGWFESAVCRGPGWQLDAQEHARIDAFIDEFGTELGIPA
ncbi:4-hydroxy-tetrahydrodipicolinate synthase [Kribbella aluminosa]|uniref:4-hydroxy-tetrahydrodipicolinate synthase n=1 Tax=Kribbella aluminosa TaxID=416017 RepID=A0ABS4UX01_9ACTN|nr:dihydrodipicolinate synthase family protein [Kribbella aluminosa]MBP2356174.1 4-hydroxy-tetrahydrodipicolinate synthase [Kribbella aluminosa]